MEFNYVKDKVVQRCYWKDCFRTQHKAMANIVCD